MRPKEVLRWALKASSPTKAETRALRDTVSSVAKVARIRDVDAATSQLLEAIEQFRSHFPHKTKRLRERSKVAETRESLRKLLDALRAASTRTRGLPFDAKARIAKQAKQPLGTLTRTLLHWEAAASETYTKMAKAKDRPENIAPSVLARDVAMILRGTLDGKISLTSDQNTSGSSRGGAAYCRLLRATLIASGATPPEDLMPILRDGKRLLDDPKGYVVLASE